MGLEILLIIVGFFTVIARSFIIIRQYEQGLKFRYGRYIAKLNPGINFIVPMLDVVAIVDMRIRTIAVPPQKVITKDNGIVKIDAVIYYRPLDAERLLLNIANYEIATIKLAQAYLRSVVGEVSFDELNSKREYINGKLREYLLKFVESWGMQVIAAEISEVLPAIQSLSAALIKEVRAERIKRAVILESEGAKEAAIINASGERQATETVASGTATAKVNVAKGEAEGIGIVAKEAKGITDNALSIWEINTWKVLSKSKSSTVLLPYNIREFIKCLKGIEGS
ncbi:hypothetical protein J4450_05370 [Candidatus Micrarchaeota archaeon]|nr:hypothetical protein [Candidatus Micrarchaeota archaeon]